MTPLVALESASHLSRQQLVARTLFWDIVINLGHDFSIDSLPKQETFSQKRPPSGGCCLACNYFQL